MKLLFDSWNLNTEIKFGMAAVAVFFSAFALEYLSSVRSVMIAKASPVDGGVQEYGASETLLPSGSVKAQPAR